MSLQQISAMSDEPLQVEDAQPKTDSSNAASDTAAGEQDSAVEKPDSTPTVAMAE